MVARGPESVPPRDAGHAYIAQLLCMGPTSKQLGAIETMTDVSYRDITDPKTATLAALAKDRLRSPVHRVLVVGCGDGREAMILARIFQAHTIGIDLGTQFAFDPEAAAQVELRVLDAQHMEFPDGCFDMVYSFHALEHMENPYRALAEMNRVLKPGGMFVIGTPNSARLVGYVSTSANAITKLRWNLHDWKMRLTGRWRNEDGAHAGYQERELWSMCASAFGSPPEIVSDEYYAHLYGARLAPLINHRLTRKYFHPCVYAIGEKSRRTGADGPVFILGLPRSGTKLLRDLLNRHPAVHIPSYETEFLPYWGREWASYGDLSQPENFRRFYRKVQVLPFFQYLRTADMPVGEEEWRALCRDFSVQAVFEALIRAVTGMGDKGGIWGDKSPSYTTQAVEIKALFPNAKFVHLVRDVRDHCLSVNKAFRKNMERAAHLWCEDLKALRRRISGFPKDALELRYEDLVSFPEEQLRRICTFLDIQFHSEMLTLDRSYEHLSEETSGVLAIVPENAGKFISRMPDETRRQIERAAAPVMRIYGYSVPEGTIYTPVPSLRLFLLKLSDGFNLLRNWKRIRMKGPLYTLFFFWRYHAITSGKVGRARWGG